MAGQRKENQTSAGEAETFISDLEFLVGCGFYCSFAAAGRALGASSPLISQWRRRKANPPRRVFEAVAQTAASVRERLAAGEPATNAPAVLNGVHDARNGGDIVFNQQPRAGDGSPRAELAVYRERMRILQRIMSLQLQDEKLKNELVRIILEG